MFKSVLDYVDSLEGNLDNLEEFLRILQGARRRVVNSIEKAEKELSILNNPTRYVASIEPQIRTDIEQLSKNILYTKALDASRTNIEFSKRDYFSALAEAIEKDQTYRITFTGSGFEKKISVRIDLNVTAGRLQDWGRAVKLYRKELKVKVPRTDSKNYDKAAKSASRAWSAMFRSGDSRIDETIRQRLGLAGTSAPFWQILDKGTVPLASDRGGYPTPRNKPTSFVQNAVTEINTQARDYISTLKGSYTELMNSVNKELSELNKRLEELDKRLQNVGLDSPELAKVKSGLSEEFLKYTSDNRLFIAIQKAKAGLEGRISVGISGKNKRLSLGRIRGLL